MLGESFINVCTKALCLIPQEKKSSLRDVMESIDYIIKWSDIKNKSKFPEEFTTGLELLDNLNQHRIEHDNFNFDVFASGLETGKVKEFLPILKSFNEQELSDNEIEDIRQNVLNKKKLCHMFTGKERLLEILNDVESGDFIDDKEIVDRWDQAVSRANDNLNEVKKMEASNKVESFDLIDGDYSIIMKDLRQIHNKKNVIPTGFKSIDELLPSGGFEQRRLYMIAGSSNIGKSTILINFIRNAIEGSFAPDEENKTLLLITGENLITESIERMYCCFTGNTVNGTVERIKNDLNFDMSIELREFLLERNNRVIIKYVRSHRTTLKDVENIVDHVANIHNLKCVYLDYIDLIRSGFDVPDIRIDQGITSMGFKTIAVDYSIPFITPTQLNRTGYNAHAEAMMTMIGESMKKIDNSDLVIFFTPGDPEKLLVEFNGGSKECKQIKMKLVKNRSGETGGTGFIYLPIRFGTQSIFNYRLTEAQKLSSVGGIEFEVNDSTSEVGVNSFTW